MSKIRYNQKGYVGSKMSVRAKTAYQSGEKPISKFNKKDVELLEEKMNELFPYPVKLKLTVKRLKQLLEKWGASSWHHTGKYANETCFYSIAYAITYGIETDLEYLDWNDEVRFYDLDVVADIMEGA